MNSKATTLLAMLLLAAPSVAAREGESGGGGHGTDDGTTETRHGGDDDPADHDADDDHGGDDGDDDGGGSGSGGGGGWQRARQDLVRDPASPDGDAYGRVEVRTRTGRERFQVEAERLDAGASVEVLVEDASGALVTAGTAVADLEGEAELELDTGDGASLPAGVSTVAELAGRRVEVRDAGGNTLLAGKVPAISGAAGSANAKATEKLRDDGTGLRVKVEFKVQGRKGRQRVRVEVRGLPSGAAAELWIADGAGSLVKAVDLSADGGGRARMRLDTRRGDTLPLAVLDLSVLGGRAFEVRMDGVTVASGNLPVL